MLMSEERSLSYIFGDVDLLASQNIKPRRQGPFLLIVAQFFQGEIRFGFGRLHIVLDVCLRAPSGALMGLSHKSVGSVTILLVKCVRDSCRVG